MAQCGHSMRAHVNYVIGASDTRGSRSPRSWLAKHHINHLNLLNVDLGFGGQRGLLETCSRHVSRPRFTRITRCARAQNRRLAILSNGSPFTDLDPPLKKAPQGGLVLMADREGVDCLRSIRGLFWLTLYSRLNIFQRLVKRLANRQRPYVGANILITAFPPKSFKGRYSRCVKGSTATEWAFTPTITSPSLAGFAASLVSITDRKPLSEAT